MSRNLLWQKRSERKKKKNVYTPCDVRVLLRWRRRLRRRRRWRQPTRYAWSLANSRKNAAPIDLLISKSNEKPINRRCNHLIKWNWISRRFDVSLFLAVSFISILRRIEFWTLFFLTFLFLIRSHHKMIATKMKTEQQQQMNHESRLLFSTRTLHGFSFERIFMSISWSTLLLLLLCFFLAPLLNGTCISIILTGFVLKELVVGVGEKPCLQLNGEKRQRKETKLNRIEKNYVSEIVSIDMRWKFKSLSDQWKNKSVLTLNVIFAHIRRLATEHDHVHLFLTSFARFGSLVRSVSVARLSPGLQPADWTTREKTVCFQIKNWMRQFFSFSEVNTTV